MMKRLGVETSWMPNRLWELISLVPKRLGAETSRAESSMCRKLGTETSVNRQNAVAVVTCRKESCPSDYLALN